MPHDPIVPAGAPGELRLDATRSEVLPEYPYGALRHTEEPHMPDNTDGFRTLGPSDALTDDYVVPDYLDDRTLRISVARFDVTTGAVVNGPAIEPLGVYDLRELDGEIQARV
jgi:hypothetical protein